MLCINHARRKTVAFSYRLYRTHAKVILDPVNPDDRKQFCLAKTKSGADRSPVTLPPRPLWKQYFPTTLKPFPYRVTLANPTTAAEVANAFIPENSVDKVVVEIFPGIPKRIRLCRHRFIIYQVQDNSPARCSHSLEAA